MMNLNALKNLCGKVKTASRKLAVVNTCDKDRALESMARSLVRGTSSILKENARDLKAASRRGLSSALIERLTLNEKKIAGMAESLAEIARLKDPIGDIIETRRRPNGLLIEKVRVPIGVILIIYESRPNVTSDCIGLCLKSSNGLILRGGKEAIHSNVAIFDILYKEAVRSGMPRDCISIIRDTDRKIVDNLLKQSQLIDLVIPRGGESLIREVTKKSRIPVIKHYKGICHTYVDEDADLDMAEKICINAKVQRPGVCNAMETMLVHKKIAADFLPSVAKHLVAAGVELRGCNHTRRLVPQAKKAVESDWYEEYLDLILAIKVVNNTEEAIRHIMEYGSYHSDAIITNNRNSAEKFLNEVDSACVFVNASTRFTDGGQFGKGAEMGISTDKIHARGPMGLEELTSYKYVVYGNGQIRK